MDLVFPLSVEMRQDREKGAASGLVASDLDGAELSRRAKIPEGLGLTVGPSVAGQSGGTGFHAALCCEESPTGRQHAVNLGQSPVKVAPVVHRGQRPGDIA